MKRILALLLLLAIPALSGCAAPMEAPPENDSSAQEIPVSGTLREQLEAPERQNGEFASESGISTITVDAEVFVPEVSHADLIEAIPRAFTREEIQTILQRHSYGYPWYYTSSREPYQGEMPELNLQAARSDVDLYEMWIYAGQSPEDMMAQKPVGDSGEFRDLSIVYGYEPGTGNLARSPDLRFSEGIGEPSGSWVEIEPLSGETAGGCTITPEEAIAMADEEVHAIAPEYSLVEFGQLPAYEVRDMRDPNSDSENTQQFYSLWYTPEIGGIPVNPGETEPGSGYDYVSGVSMIQAVVRDGCVCNLYYFNPGDMGEIREENVELLPFSEIWDIFSQVGLLSIQHLEVYENLQVNRRTVTEIRLGYMKILQPDRSYLYTPVWDFYGTQFLAGTGEYAGGWEVGESSKKCLLTINAIDGTVVDRELGY